MACLRFFRTVRLCHLSFHFPIHIILTISHSQFLAALPVDNVKYLSGHVILSARQSKLEGVEGEGGSEPGGQQAVQRLGRLVLG